MADELLRQMHDIDGLDYISYWPLGIGWWLLIIGMVILAVIIMYLWVKRKRYRASWLYLIYNNLVQLENHIPIKSKKYIVNELSEYLRQIAIKKYPRDACASLSGKTWLVWLTAHDPKNFNWVHYGDALILGPYAPDLQDITMMDLQRLIQAAKNWVK